MATTARRPLSQIIAVTDMPWQEREPGMRTKSLWADPATRRRAVMNRIDPGVQGPRHRHVGDELIFVLEGANADESGVVSTGNMNYRPDGCVHTVTTKNGATLLAVVWGHTDPV